MAGPAANSDGLSDCWQEHDVDQRKVMTQGSKRRAMSLLGPRHSVAHHHAHTDRGRPARLKIMSGQDAAVQKHHERHGVARSQQ